MKDFCNLLLGIVWALSCPPDPTNYEPHTQLQEGFSNPPMTEAKLCRSWTGCWEIQKSEPGLNFKD